MLKIRSLGSPNFSKAIWNSSEQPDELTWKLAVETTTWHSWYCYVVTIVSHCYVVILEGLKCCGTLHSSFLSRCLKLNV